MVAATREAEVGGSRELRRSRHAHSTALLHSSLINRARFCLHKKIKIKNTMIEKSKQGVHKDENKAKEHKDRLCLQNHKVSKLDWTIKILVQYSYFAKSEFRRWFVRFWSQDCYQQQSQDQKPKAPFSQHSVLKQSNIMVKNRNSTWIETQLYLNNTYLIELL